MPRYKVRFDNELSVTFHAENEGDVEFYVPCQIHYNSRDVNGSEKDDEGRVKFSIESDDAKKIFDILHPLQEMRYLIVSFGELGRCPLISYLQCKSNFLEIGIIASINVFDHSEIPEPCPTHLLGKNFDEGYDSHASAISP